MIRGTCTTAFVLAGALASGCRFDGNGLAAGSGDMPVDAPIASSIDAAVAITPDARPPSDAAPPPPMPGVVHAKWTNQPPTIDGQGGDFQAAGAIPYGFDIADGVVTDFLGGYTASQDSTFQILHDAANIYVFARVIDDSVQVDSQQTYDDDSVNLYLDVANDRSGAYGDDDHELIVAADASWWDFGPATSLPTVTAARVLTSTGWNVEFRIAKTGLFAPVGNAIGFDFALNDDDDGQGYDGYGLWYEKAGPRCADCCTGWSTAQAWCDTTMLGQLLLDPKP